MLYLENSVLEYQCVLFFKTLYTLFATTLKECDSYLQRLQLQCSISGDFHGIWNVKLKIGNLNIGYGNAKLETERGLYSNFTQSLKFLFTIPLRMCVNVAQSSTLRGVNGS